MRRDGSFMRRILSQPQVATVVVIITYIRTYPSDKMAATKDDYVIEKLSATTADPALRHGVLPRTAVPDATRLDTHRLDSVQDSRTENRVSVEY